MKIGPVTLTRDSALLWLGTLGGVVMYLQNAPAPFWQWDYHQWMAALGIAITGLSLKLQNSALASSSEVAKGIRDNGTPLALLLAVGLTAGALSGCATLGSAKHRAAISVVSADAVLSAIQDTENGLVCGRATAPAPPACVPLEEHRAISAKLATAFQRDRQIAQTIRALPAGASSPDVAVLVGQIRALVDEVLALIPDSAPRRALMSNIGGQ
jgi:hypothetical protein